MNSITFDQKSAINFSSKENKNQELCETREGLFLLFSRYVYTHTSQSARNAWRVSLAGLLPFLGGIIAADSKIFEALGISSIYLGSFVGGIGNAFSTWTTFETNLDHRLENLERDAKTLRETIKNLRIGTSNINLDALEKGEGAKRQPTHAMRNVLSRYIYAHTSQTTRNIVRVSTAGGLSFLGILVSADSKIVNKIGSSAVYLGSFFSGAGNAASAWLGWENDDESQLDKLELALQTIDVKIKMLSEENERQKSIVIENVQPQIDLSILEKGEGVKSPSMDSIRQIFSRYFYTHTSQTTRNLAKVTTAGTLSFLGSVIASDPRIAICVGTSAVYIGSFVGGSANALSTWFTWETNFESRIDSLEEEIKSLQKEAHDYCEVKKRRNPENI